MNDRETLLFLVATDEAKDMYGTTDLSMDQWAKVYDSVEQYYGRRDIRGLRDLLPNLAWPTPAFSITSWVADEEYGPGYGLDDGEWAAVEDHVVKQLMPFTNGALFNATDAADAPAAVALAN